MKSNHHIAPGWKMTFAQRAMYFRMFADVARAKGWTGDKEQMAAHRYEFHKMAGLRPVSAKAIDHLKGFDAMKACWLSITQPENLDAQINMANMPRHRTITRIKSMCAEGYWRALLASERFLKRELEELDDSELTNFRNTLEARIAAWKRNGLEAASDNYGRNRGAEQSPSEAVSAPEVEEPF